MAKLNVRIWVDIANAPHVNFFQEFVADWRQSGHEVLVTARPLSNTIPLLDRSGMHYQLVGRHYGGRIVAKILGFPIRCLQLWWYLRGLNVDVAISQSSFYSPIVARMLRVPVVYTNDNEFAKGNFTAFLFANRILLPEPLRDWVAGRFFQRRVKFYPGIKEGIYTHQLVQAVADCRAGKRGDLLRIVFRPEPWTAQYHSANRQLFSSLVEDLARSYNVLVLPRGEEQTEFFSACHGLHLKVQTAPLTILEICEICDVFIGAGGSMSREFAYLGVPTISTYGGQLLAVDKYLLAQKAMVHVDAVSAIAIRGAIDELTNHASARVPTEDGRLAYEIIRNSVFDVAR